MRQAVVAFICRHQLLKAGDRVGVAVSGGADSVALLRVLLDLRKDLGIVLSVVHFNHCLRAEESDADERFVAELAQRHRLEFHRESAEVKRYAGEKHLSLEAAARRLRYQFFERLLQQDAVNCVATGHTLDDQAETVLLRVVRGAGTRGLAGIYPKRKAASGCIIRPLLGVRRYALEAYLQSIHQDWCEDGSNRDLRFARNRIRHGILPRLERALNPAVREALAELSDLSRAEESYWEGLAAQKLPQVFAFQSPAGVFRAQLTGFPLALRRRLVRAGAEALGLNLEFKHVEDILAVADGAADGAALPHGWQALRLGDEVRLQREVKEAPRDYEYALPVPGKVVIPEAGIVLEAALIAALTGYNREQYLDRSVLSQPLRVRNWRPGDRFWPAHTKAPKKIKELLQDKHVLGSEKKLWPVITSGEQIVWMRGFAAPEQFVPRGGGGAVMIREIPDEECATR